MRQEMLGLPRPQLNPADSLTKLKTIMLKLIWNKAHIHILLTLFGGVWVITG